MSGLKPVRINPSKQNIKKKSVGAQIKEALKSGSFVEIKIDELKNPPYHDRRYISRLSIIELAENIKNTNGLIYPIVVRERTDGTLERIAGYRRVEAYKYLKKESIPAIILTDLSDEDAILFMISENMQREDLSPYDETLALIDYLSVSLDISSEQTIKTLFRFKNFISGRLQLEDDEKDLHEKSEEILKRTGKITVSGLVNRLFIFNMHSLIKDELTKGTLSFSNAQILNKIKHEKILASAIKTVIEKNYSKRETQEYVRLLLNNEEESSAIIVSKKMTIENKKDKCIVTIPKNLDKSSLKELEGLIKDFIDNIGQK